MVIQSKLQRSSNQQQTIKELDQICSRLTLQLPASRTSVYQQQQQLILKRQQLVEILRSHVLKQSDPLLDLIEQSIHKATNLIHLAEEYPIDPEGTISCLSSP